MSLLRQLVHTASRDSTRVAAWIALGGIALMAANLLLAAVLPPDDFGRLTLVEALLSVGVGMGPLGFTDLVVRREIPVEWRSMIRISVLTVIPALLLGMLAYAVYGLGPAASGMVAAGCAGGGVGLLCASFDRADIRFDRAQAVSQLPFLVFSAGAFILYLRGGGSWLIAVTILAGGYVFSAAVGLVVFSMRRFRRPGSAPGIEDVSWRARWRKALMFFGIAASSLVLSQVERFIIPRALSLTDLAVFGVAATLVLGPYKLLQGGIGYALMPRLRASAGASERRKLIQQEMRFALGTSAALAAAAISLVPFATRFLYGDKYPVGVGLVVVVSLIGALRAVYSVLAAVVKALGGKTHLTQYHLAGWVSVAIAIGGAYALARFGLVGVMLGVVVAWLARSWVGGLIAKNALEHYLPEDGVRPARSDSSVPAQPM